MKFPKIRISHEPKPVKPKIFCCQCKIRLGGFRNKPIEYEDGFYCAACHSKRIIQEKTKPIKIEEEPEEKEDEPI